MKKFSIIGIVFLLAACCDKNDTACRNEEASAQATEYVATEAAPPQINKQDDRITVTRVKVIGDSLAYGGQRGVYLIRDNQTGTEYVGISGVGVSEIGSHSCGKGCTARDER